MELCYIYAMENSYRTLAGSGRAEIAVKRSRFIAVAAPLRSVEEARSLLAGIKSAHRDASHHVWAYALRNGERRYSDDGEPQGSAGLPILDLLQKQNLTDCAVVVTRYFGGTLLGAGGLARTYTQTAMAAVEAAGTAVMVPCHVLRVRCDYAFYGRLQTLVPACGGLVLDTAFGEGVSLTLRIGAGEAAPFAARLREASGGKAACEPLREEYAAV